MTSEHTEENVSDLSPAAGESAGAWRDALATRRTRQREGDILPGAQASRIDTDVTRRRFILGSFWAGLGTTMMGAVGSLGDFMWPRNTGAFGGPVPAGNVSEYRPGGDPVHNLAGKFWIVNLDPAETLLDGTTGAGLLALYQKCPHLGCTVPWARGFRLPGFEGKGWFRCPCHGSTYTKAGVRKAGPAPRPMDTMRIEVDEAGNITVQTGDRTNGGEDNPQRAGAPYWGGTVEEA